MKDLGTKVSTLWIVVMFTMVFADIVGMMMPGVLEAMSTGQVGVPVTQGLLLVFAMLLQIPIPMIYLSRVLKPRLNRWANTVAAILTSLFVVGGGSPYLHYYFFATVEVACMALIRLVCVVAARLRGRSEATGGPAGSSRGPGRVTVEQRHRADGHEVESIRKPLGRGSCLARSTDNDIGSTREQ